MHFVSTSGRYKVPAVPQFYFISWTYFCNITTAKTPTPTLVFLNTIRLHYRTKLSDVQRMTFLHSSHPRISTPAPALRFCTHHHSATSINLQIYIIWNQDAFHLKRIWLDKARWQQIVLGSQTSKQKLKCSSLETFLESWTIMGLLDDWSFAKIQKCYTLTV